MGWTTASFWHLPWGEIRVATVILLVLVAATLWIQARARTKTALEPARLSLNQKRFDEAIAICQRTLAQAPGNPATKYPMNPVVMTTGPGVIIATATASKNCLSESH